MAWAESKVMKDISYAFSWNEIERILESAKQENFRDYALLATLAYSGRRVCEIVPIRESYRIPQEGLKVKDIDFENGVIAWSIEKQFDKVRHGDIVIKQRRKRLIKASPKLLEILKEYIRLYNLKEDDVLFDISRQRVWQIVKKYMEKAGINKRRIVHAFRHGFAIETIKKASNPEDLLTVKNLLAHSSLLTTQSYLVFAKTKEEEILSQL